MNPTDPIVLTAYLLCISYFLYKIKESFNDEYTIKLDEDGLKQQLAEQNLQDLIGISFVFDKRYEFDKLKQLSISISNKSDTHPVYVDWDYSTITDLGNRSRRVTRLMPGTTLDLFQNQVFSNVAPKTTLKEIITAEDLLDRKGDGQQVEVKKPLIDLKPAKPSDDLRRRLNRFMKQQENLEFSLGLRLRTAGADQSGGADRVYIVLCKFIMQKLPWTAGLPWNPKT